VRYESVQNVRRGTEVTLRGVRVGKVLTVLMEEGRPLVLIGFRDLRDLPKDSRIVQRGVGMLGERLIEVQMGRSSEVLADGALVEGVSELGVEDLTSEAADAAGKLRSAVDSLVSDENLRRVSRTIEQLDAATADLRRLVEANREKLSSTMGNLSEASSDAKELVGGAREKVARSVDNLESASAELKSSAGDVKRATEAFERSMGHLESISRKIDGGEGTLGRLVNDDGLARRIEAAVTSADSLIGAIKTDPGRYLNFRFTLF
jgi:phospholipid/cholesterol/gamma-HCH transport system substrate-binding protein